MKKYFIPLLSIILISCSAGNINYIAFDEAMENIDKTQKESWVFIGDQGLITKIQKYDINRFISKYKNTYDFYFCDISLQNNEHVNFIYQLETLPCAMLISPQKKVKYITNFPFDSKLVSQLNQINSQDAPQLTNANFKIKGEILSSYFSNIYNAYPSLDSDNIDSLKKGLDNINKSISTEPYFYNYYLGYKLTRKLDRDSISNQYREHAITWFESNTAPLYTYLNAELLQSDTTKTAKIEFDTKMVDFGEISIKTPNKKVIKYSNTGNAPLVIVSALTSCSCIKVTWEQKPLLTGQVGEICITYNGSEENLGAFNRSIILITNATKRNEILTAKGQATL